uniref:Ovule protein n=1 Tax=Ascaris lumbricoides TaxID=6252 RepID=A0A0M3IAS7_ASCLU
MMLFFCCACGVYYGKPVRHYDYYDTRCEISTVYVPYYLIAVLLGLYSIHHLRGIICCLNGASLRGGRLFS